MAERAGLQPRCSSALTSVRLLVVLGNDVLRRLVLGVNAFSLFPRLDDLNCTNALVTTCHVYIVQHTPA